MGTSVGNLKAKLYMVVRIQDRFREKGPNAYFFKISNFLIFYTLFLTH